MIAFTQENSYSGQQISSVSETLDLQELLQENRTLRCDKNIYKSLLERATAREQLLKQEIQQLNARICYLEKRLYGRKSEKKTSKPKNNSSTASSCDGQPKRNRGHQPGSPGHGRRDYNHLPVQEETFGLDEAVCPHCGCPYREDTFLGTEDSELVEVEVYAYRRKVRRKKYRKCCQCKGTPGIVTAPGPGKLFDKGKLGISVWVKQLYRKFIETGGHVRAKGDDLIVSFERRSHNPIIAQALRGKKPVEIPWLKNKRLLFEFK